MKVFKYLFILFFLFVTTYFFPVHAQEYKTVYDTHYYIDETGNTNVQMYVSFPDLSADIYIKEFSLQFPESFSIDNVSARIQDSNVPVSVVKENGSYKVTLSFNNPQEVSKDTNTKKFLLTYNQKHLFTTAGNIIEVFLPAFAKESNATTNITVHLPKNFNKKINIAKPIPTSIHDKEIYWENVNTRTVYAVFGESQLYNTNLTYHLLNQESHPVFIEIALPPETQYQKIYLNSLTPKPKSVSVDSDGNYLARYDLLIGQKMDVVYNGTIEIFTKSQPEMNNVYSHQINLNKNYLLSPQKYWDIENNSSLAKIANLKSPQDIFEFTTTTLSYNFDRVKTGLKRLGANEILLHPLQAVCTEFTDLFIAIAREKGIYTREIQGYGYSEDQRLRPITQSTDILHSWPEYFDETKKIWVPVDPTWENTSGIDYFNSLDLNHIAFVIHGKDASYPYPAGSYKTSNTKDVDIKVTQNRPTEILKFDIKENFDQTTVHNKTSKASITITNSGNVYLKDSVLTLDSQNINLNPRSLYVDLLPPMASKTFEVSYTSGNEKEDTITINLNQKKIKTIPVKITTSFEASYAKILLFLLGLSIIVGLLIAYRKREEY